MMVERDESKTLPESVFKFVLLLVVFVPLYLWFSIGLYLWFLLGDPLWQLLKKEVLK